MSAQNEELETAKLITNYYSLCPYCLAPEDFDEVEPDDHTVVVCGICDRKYEVTT